MSIIECYQFTPASLQIIAENCTDLTHVTILQNVTSADSYPYQPSPAVQAARNEAYKDLLGKRGAFLQVLEIDAEFVCNSTLERCPRLRLLNLYGMSNIDGSSLRLIPEKAPSSKLLAIGKSCTATRKQLLEDLVVRCPDLEIKPYGPVTLAVNCWDL